MINQELLIFIFSMYMIIITPFNRNVLVYGDFKSTLALIQVGISCLLSEEVVPSSSKTIIEEKLLSHSFYPSFI